MTFITLPQSGAVIDLDSVAFVVKTQSRAGNGIKIGAGGLELSFFFDDARQFLAELRNRKGVDVKKLLKEIPVT